MAVWSETNVIEISQNKRIDSEFFHPEFILADESVNRVSNTSHLGLLGQFVIGPFGSAFHVNNYDPSSIYRYIRGKDVKPFQLKNDDNVYMPEKDYYRLSKYSVYEDDLIISVVGTLGNVAIIPEDITGIFSCKSTLFRNSSIDAYYLLAYLNSKYGQKCLLRRQRGAVQTGLNKEDLKTVPVPLFSDKDHKHIGDLIRKALKLNSDSQSLYTQAQQLLEQELGMDKLAFEKPVGYEASFSEVMSNNRADAEFYRIEFDPIIDSALGYRNGWMPLNQLTNRILPNINVKNFIKNFGYIEIGDVSISDGSYVINTIFSKDLPENAKIKLNGGEILISQVRPTRGAIAIIENELQNDTICSGAFYVCRPKEAIQGAIIWLYLRVIKNVFEKFCGGTSYPTIDSHYIAKYPVPIFENRLTEQIHKLVSQSKNAQDESHLLLKKAKTRVEQLIEQAADGK